MVQAIAQSESLLSVHLDDNGAGVDAFTRAPHLKAANILNDDTDLLSAELSGASEQAGEDECNELGGIDHTERVENLKLQRYLKSYI